MNREQAKELLPIIKAFAEGKTVQSLRINGNWVDLGIRDTLSLITLKENPQKYRIKPKPKYRPFKDKEECWQEMLKHQPFSWIKAISNKYYYSILEVVENGCIFVDGPKVSFYDLFKFDTFADETPFGIKEE